MKVVKMCVLFSTHGTADQKYLSPYASTPPPIVQVGTSVIIPSFFKTFLFVIF